MNKNIVEFFDIATQAPTHCTGPGPRPGAVQGMGLAQ